MSNYKIKSLKDLSVKIGDGLHGTPEYVDSSNYYFINGNNLKNGVITFTNSTNCVSRETYFNNKKKLNNQTILISINGTIGNIALFENESVILGKSVAFINLKNNINKNFIFYYLQSFEFKKMLLKDLNNTTVKNLSLESLRKFKIKLPPLSEQTIIANYLFHQISKIDKKIYFLQQKSILLDEYKNALIYETVTKGLDKNEVMKDSGVEWIGETPNHWKIKRIKNIFNSLGGGNYGDDENVNILNLPCISISDFKNGNLSNTDKVVSSRSYNKDNTLKKGTILLEKSGGGEKNPVGRVIYLLNDINAYYTNFVQGLKSVEHSKFSYYLMKTIHSNKFHMNFVKQNTGLQNFNYNGFSKLFFVSIPPKNEQINIVDFLDLETAKIEQQIELINKKVELLKEYKQSLIYEAVTGQLEIE